MLSKGAIGNLVRKYRAVLNKCRLLNAFGTLAVAGMLVMGGAGAAGAATTAYLVNKSVTEDINFNGAKNYGFWGGSADDGSVQSHTLSGNQIHFTLTTPSDTSGWGVSGIQATRNAHVTLGSETTKNIHISVTNNASSDKQYAYGIFAQDSGSSITIKAEELSITAHSDQGEAHGLLAQNKTTTATGNLATITVNAAKTYIDATSNLAGAASAITAMSQGVITLDGGDLYVNTRGGTGRAITSRGAARIDINPSGRHTVQLNGDIGFDYHPTSGTSIDAPVTVNLSGPDSYWNGNTVKAWDGGGTAPDADKLVVKSLTVSLANGAQWTPRTIADTGNKTFGSAYIPLNKLNLDKGVVNLDPGVNVTVDNLNGSGTVNLDANVGDAAEAGSLKAVDGTATLAVNLANVTADDVSNEKAAALVAQATQGSTATLAVTGHAEEGLVRGALTIDSAGNVTEATNTVMEDSLDLLSVTPLAVNRILMNDVRKRLGDLRVLNGDTGLWVRYDGGRLSGSSSLKDNFNTIQVGADTLTPLDNLRLGAVFSYTNGDAEYRRGDADMDIFSLGLYGVWNADNGLFADVIGRLNWIDTDLDVEGRHGSVDNFAASISAEAGWNVRLNDWFFVEPQIEAAYTHIDSDRFSLGVASYHLDSMESLIGRGGLSAGVNLPDKRGSVYARASAVHEFLGDAKIVGRVGSLGGACTIGGEDTWVEYGIGGTVRLTDQAYVYLDLERTDGARIDEEWRGSLGFRYAF